MNELDSKFKKELDNEDIRFLKEYGKNINKLMKFASKYKPLSVAAMEDEFNKIKKAMLKLSLEYLNSMVLIVLIWEGFMQNMKL